MHIEKRNNRITILLAMVCLLSLLVMTVVLMTGAEPNRAEFTPPPFDENACAGFPQVPGELGWGVLDARVYKVGVCGVVRAQEDAVEVWLTNPEENTVWMKLRMLDSSGEILGQTGLIKPGEYVQTLRLDTDPPDNGPVTLKIMAYQPDTYYSEGVVTLNTTITRGEVK